MQEYWELYMKSIDGHRALVSFNAGISMDIEELSYTHPIVAFVKLELKEPKENGLVSKEESSKISFIEDRLEAAILKFRIGKYVGRVFSNGSVTFIFYLQFTYNWEDFLEYALSDIDKYQFSSGFQDDNEWNFYKNLLFPTNKEWQIIQNHKASNALEANGDDLQQKRAIEHKIFFIDSKSDELIKRLESDGFKIMENIKNDEGVEGIKFYRLDKPFYYDIDDLTLYLIDLSSKFGAMYDGWECSLVKA